MLQLLFFIFQLQADFVQAPQSCVSKNIFPCIVYGQNKGVVRGDEIQFYVSSGALFEWKSPADFFLTQGHFWFLTKKKVKISTLFVQTEIEPGEYLISYEQDRVFFTAISGGMSFSNPKSSTLGSGEQIVCRSHLSGGCSYPLPLDVRMWSFKSTRFFPFQEKNYDLFVRDLGRASFGSLHQMTQIHKKIVERKVASVEEEELRKKGIFIYRTQLEKDLRQLFLRKSRLEDP